MKSADNLTLVILTGPMRSGTTLLGNMLHGGATARHSELSFAPDTVTDLRDVTPEAARVSGQRLPLMNRHVSSQFLDAWSKLAAAALPGFKDKVLQAAPVTAPRVYGGKLTALLPELIALSAMPGVTARFLIMQRDPRDIFASGFKRYGGEGEAGALAFMNAALSLDYREAEVPNSMRVSYEALVEHPREQLSAVLQFIGLDAEKYDWSALDKGLISNSSFANIGPNDLVQGSGIKPSIGRHTATDEYHSAALAEIFEVGQRAGIATRIRIYEEFLPEVLRVGARYGYALDGLREAVKRRRGALIPLILSVKRIYRSAREKLSP